jgi:predicted O-linked N-acetylglucosamine transferase (SPINDLY family)
MTTAPLTIPVDWQEKAYNCLLQGSYSQAVNLYEQALEIEPEIKSHYWHLGLLLLLQGQETEAQTIWLMAMADEEPQAMERLSLELITILQTEANRQVALQEYSIAWCIRQHIREICPEHLENLLHLIILSKILETLREDCTFWNIVPLLRAQPPGSLPSDLLLQALDVVLDLLSPDEIVFEFTDACLDQIEDLQALKNVVVAFAFNFSHARRQTETAIQLIELCLSREPNSTELLSYLAPFAQNAGDYEKGIEAAKRCRDLADNLPEKLFASHLLIRGLMTASGRWEQAIAAWQSHKQLIESLTLDDIKVMDIGYTLRLFTSTYYLPYFLDAPHQNRTLQTHVNTLCQENVRLWSQEQADRYQHRHSLKKSFARPKRLKIGYLSHCMANHSVGWLARWLIQHHDRERFEIHGYFMIPKPNDPLYNWYVSSMDHAHQVELNSKVDSPAIAEAIYTDEIDVLVDLDSITLDISCAVMSLKPAPIQVSWLGWDASGIPAIDYYIADPYVLPESAQRYYCEKIWRLPQTYIAVDGFEVDVPTLRRDTLDIPTDAVIFLSAQRGHKRHPETAKLQLQIIKQVPSSYFLIKGASDESSLKNFFTTLAEEVGVSLDRLRFLPETNIEAAHRANLAIADVVLDTFPYNGATTTLETLWMGIPIVTRVGEQFAARNSYTMMMNAGITEGIAFTDAEYIEWGVRLGTDANLRQQVAWKLRQSRQTAPLWNAKQFTREMEQAYEQMWTIYTKSK